jgi:hypothetical protein
MQNHLSLVTIKYLINKKRSANSMSSYIFVFIFFLYNLC